jgi:hypothetical protein
VSDRLARLVSQIGVPQRPAPGMNPNLVRIGAAPRVASTVPARLQPERELQARPVVSGQPFNYGGRPGGVENRSGLSQVGEGLMGLLRTLDKPRSAVVSTIQELEDMRQGRGFSPTDWREQFNRNIGFQEVLDNSGMAGGWQRTALGFVGDVVTDPLLYVAPQTVAARVGGKAVARTAAQVASDDAMRVAVNSGSSKIISNTLAKNAVDAGLFDNPAVQQLIVSAAERGRGALTTRGLARAGVNPQLADDLGLPGLAKVFGTRNRNVQLPLSRRWADVTEDVKGGLKRSFRLRPGAQVGRDKFIPTVAGQRELTKSIYNQLLPVGERAARVLARNSVNASLTVARRWTEDTTHRLVANLRENWYNLTPDEARVLTNNIESGVSGVAEDAWRVEARRILDELQAAGVDIGDLGPDYVPHVRSDEFMDLTRKNADARQWAVDNLRTEEGLQRTRTLQAGSDFFNDEFGGLPLQTGTIAEINERSMKGFGVKLFKDDLRDIFPFYTKSAGEALQRTEQINALTKLGLTSPTATKIVQEANKDPKYLRQVASAEKKLGQAKLTERVEAARAAQTRRDALSAGVRALRDQSRKFTLERRKLQNELNVLERRALRFKDTVDDLGAQLQAAQTAADAARAAVAGGRTSQRAMLRRELKQNEKIIADLRVKLDEANARYEQLKPKTDRPVKSERRLRATERAQLDALSLSKRIEFAEGQAEQINRQIQDTLFENTPPGQGWSDADTVYRNAESYVELLLSKQSKAVDASEAAAAAYSFALAPNTWAIDQLGRTIAELQRGIRVGVDAGPAKIGPRPSQARLMDLKQRFDTINEVLRRTAPDDPATLALAKLEAAAAASDAAAARAGNDVKTFTKMLDALADKKFIDTVVDDVADGMVAIGRGLQIPEWLDQALTVRAIADEAPEIHRYMRKFYNLFKGYAILRPGFHTRNLYSAVFNMYLEGGAGSIVSAQEFFKFFRLVEKNPNDYMDLARKQFGAAKAERLNDAWGATAGTGSGQIAGELTTSALRPGTWNPGNEDFILLKGSRRTGEWVENRVRGAHAYDVLNRGGTMEQAMDIVQKWQFNYTDITRFDQQAKLINPFWIFFSRNIALQAQEWARTGPRLNRTVENFRRNVGYSLEDDRDVPEWFREEGAIPLGRGADGMRYLFTDLPAVVWPGDVGELTDPSEMSRLLGTAGPWLSVPLELISGRQMFSGIPIKDVYEPMPGGTGRLPGVSMLPFVEQGAEGPMMTAKSRSALMSILPGLGQVERLFPATDAARERAQYSRIAYLTGIGMRENTPRSQRGEQYRQLLEEQAARRKRESLGYAS